MGMTKCRGKHFTVRFFIFRGGYGEEFWLVKSYIWVDVMQISDATISTFASRHGKNISGLELTANTTCHLISIDKAWI